MGWHGPYKERKYAVGQRLLTLRTKAKLTQVELATLVGVNRRSIQNWETGAAYPKERGLQHLIAVFLVHAVFALGGEQAEATTLWELVRQDAPHSLASFDELWFTQLLAGQGRQRPAVDALLPASQPPSSLLMDWGEAIDVPVLYGRDEELATLQQWVLADHCRVVALLGLGGIGKSSLAVTFANQVAGAFDAVCFRSLRNAPRLGGVLDDLLHTVSPQPAPPPEPVAEKITLLIQRLREQRCLIVLDDLETLLQPGATTGDYRADYADYGTLIQRLGEVAHQSCLLLTSREKPVELGPLEGRTAPVRTLPLAGLTESACQTILQEKDVYGTDADCVALAHLYGGNPLALKLVSEPIRELFGGDIQAFLAAGDAFFDGVGKLLEQQFSRSTPLEQAVLYWLAIVRELAPLETLRTMLAGSAAQRDLLVALESLRRRLLIERGTNQPGFTLQPVILEYVTDRLVTQVLHEMVDGQPRLLCSHALVQATAKEYVRHTQERLIATPLLEQLVASNGGPVAVEQLLVERLQRWRGQPVAEQGYGPGNGVNLLRLLRGHLRGLDLSRLALRNLYLQDVELQDASLAQTLIQDCVLTETFDVMSAVAISRDGKYLASATRRGQVRVWYAGDSSYRLTLHRVWQAHTDMISGLDFGSGHTLASTGGADSTVKLWDIASGALLWSGSHLKQTYRVIFSPDGRLLASCGNDGLVRIWAPQHQAQLMTLPHPDPVDQIAWSPTSGLFASGDEQGVIRLWALDLAGNEPPSAICVQTLTGHRARVEGLAFAPDGQTLASAGWDGKVILWAIAGSGARLVETLNRFTQPVTRVAWSPDGHQLAISGLETTIWLWNVEQHSYGAALQGHRKAVTCLAFSPDNQGLLSGGQDGSLRLWDVASGQCLRVLQGYAATIHDIDWNPDGAQLASGGADARVTIFTVDGATPPSVLYGHGSEVYSVAWSVQGHLLASSEWYNMIRLWDATSGVCLHLLQHPDDPSNYFYRVAWSPDGKRLAFATYARGVEVFERMTPPPSGAGGWRGEPVPVWILHVVWSPDGKWLAGGGDDGVVYVWDATDGTIRWQLTGHHDMVMNVAWSPDGKRLASGSRGKERGELFVWDLQRGERAVMLAGHAGMVSAVAWAAGSGAPVISGGDDGELRWWDLSRGECIRICAAHQGTVQALKLSPDGTKLASCGDDGAIRIWDLDSGESLQTLRRDRPYERMDITGVTGLTSAQVASLKALGAVETLGRVPPGREQ